MPISVTCGQCQHTVSVRDEFAGKRGKCPKCQAVVAIPAATAVRLAAASAQPAARNTAQPAPKAATQAPVRNAAPPATPAPAPAAAKPRPAGPPSPDQIRAKVLGGFQGTIERVPTTPLYKLGIVATALVMVLLPLIYIGIIALVCLLVWWHLTNNIAFVGAVRGRAAIVALMIYLAPAIVGAILIAFMVKPIFARASGDRRRRSLTHKSDPLLFEFVERICSLVGAAQPRRIDIDCDINASASFRNGWLSLIGGRDLVLTIGMPLAAGLSLQQFAGVLAHEFGHFSQGAGMRLTYIIRSINFWFMRAVYERDSWDDWLAGAATEADLRIGWILYLAMGCVWVTRKILWLLMYAGHLVAGFMLRQMEFDADKYEARVAGSETFAATARQLKLLGVAWHGAQADLASYHREGRLADNLPRLLMANLKQLPKAAHEYVAKQIAETETGSFDSHPADKDRIESARAEQSAGVFRSDLPATVLFDGFDQTAKNVTWDYYRSIFGPTVKQNALHNTDELLARTENEQAASKAANRFFAGAFNVLRPLRLPVMQGQTTQHPSVWKAELAETRAAMESQAESYRQTLEAFDKADTRLVQARQARSVLSCGVQLLADKFDQPFTSDSHASRIRDGAQTEIARCGNRMEAFEESAGRRLRAGLLLLFDPATAVRLSETEAMQQECRCLLPIANQVANNHAGILELRNNNATLVALLGHLDGQERNESLIREILDFGGRVRKQLADLKQQFERVDYPFDHAEGKMSIGRWLVQIVPPEEEVGAVFEAGDQVLNKLLELYARALSRLCVIAEAVEATFGYSPLPVPDKSESSQ